MMTLENVTIDWTESKLPSMGSDSNGFKLTTLSMRKNPVSSGASNSVEQGGSGESSSLSDVSSETLLDSSSDSSSDLSSDSSSDSSSVSVKTTSGSFAWSEAPSTLGSLSVNLEIILSRNEF